MGNTVPKQRMLFQNDNSCFYGMLFLGDNNSARRVLRWALKNCPTARRTSSFLLGSGLGNTQIANSLNLSVKTIESHRENIKHKLDLSCSRDLVACAKKYVEVTLVPPTNITTGSKKKVVRFPAG